MKQSTITISVMTFAAFAAIYALIVWKDILMSGLGAEGYKQILQFSLLTVLGGLVSTLYAEFKREQDQKSIRRLQLITFYDDVLSQYNKSKKLRRLLRALVSRLSALPQDEAEGLYTDLLIQLEDIQLEFESFQRQVTVQGGAFPEQSKILVNLTKIQKFLREVVREYEEGAISRKADISPSILPCLNRFMLEQGGDFVQYVAIPFEEVEAVLLRELDRGT